MVIIHQRLVREIHTCAGPRYIVKVPEPVCPIPGFRAYALLALSRNGDPDQRLTLYERIDAPPDIHDDRLAA